MTSIAQRPHLSHKRRLAALLGAVTLVAASCGGSSSDADDQKTPVDIPVASKGSFTTSDVSCSGVSVYPSPDTATASPATQVSFRNIDSTTITDTAVTVTGSATGEHTGDIVADSDGRGASFHPEKPFDAGETVTVTAPEQICGADDSSASFQIGSDDIAPLPKPKKTDDDTPETTAADLQHFASEPGLEPPVLDVTKANPNADEGYYFMGPKSATIDGGPMITNGDGNLVWYQQVSGDDMVADFRVQTYKGEPVLTWWEGVIDKGNGTGKGHIVNSSYEPVATVEAGNGYAADMHEFLLDGDTAWITIYHKSPGDLTALGGAKNAAVLDSIVQQIDIATGNVLFEWHSLDHVDADTGAVDYDTESARAYDYFHVNSIDPSGDGTILVSARNTNAIYLLNRATGDLVWTLGGSQTDFDMGTGTPFVFQHDARLRGDRYITIFDNETKKTPARIIALDVDIDAKKVSLVWEHTAPDDIPVVAQGNLQFLEDGNTVTGWGSSSVEGKTKGT
ncbi:MAG TPA: arylsulfotransferase family protein, partial [Acidimicrobiales bacterium]|nr:arylsulfotransferase family protein [Acidimicrobiales bacterium]